MNSTTWVKPVINLILSVAHTEKTGASCEGIGDFNAGDNPCS
jgi:hypothetical protein